MKSEHNNILALAGKANNRVLVYRAYRENCRVGTISFMQKLIP
jgi:hypothetical protein